MSTQLVAIFVVLGLALVVLLFGWGALAVASREEADLARWLETMAAVGRAEWPASANDDYPAGEPDQDGSEHDDG